MIEISFKNRVLGILYKFNYYNLEIVDNCSIYLLLKCNSHNYFSQNDSILLFTDLSLFNTEALNLL